MDAGGRTIQTLAGFSAGRTSMKSCKNGSQFKFGKGLTSWYGGQDEHLPDRWYSKTVRYTKRTTRRYDDITNNLVQAIIAIRR